MHDGVLIQLMQSVLGPRVSKESVIVLAGVAKLLVGDIVEESMP